MSLLDGVRHRLRVVLIGEAYAREVEREIRFHLELERAHRAHTGLPQIDAELTARRDFGNVTYYREEIRRMTPLRWLDRIRQDASHAWRGLLRAPGFTTAVVLTLGLGIGVNAAMFALLDRLFMQPPSGVGAPAGVRRMYMEIGRPTEPGGRLAHDTFRYPQYRAIAAALDSSLGAIAAFTPPDSEAMVDGGARLPVRVSYVTEHYFRVLGVRPAIGRFLASDEGRIETPTPVVIVSDELWRRVFHTDLRALGRRVVIGRQSFTVIGIAPRHFTGIDLDGVDAWVPANMYNPGSGAMPGPWYDSFQNSFRVVARPVSRAAEDRMLAVATTANAPVDMAGYFHDTTARVLSGPIIQALGPMKPGQEVAILTRLGAVSLIVLIIACANVTNLLLLRATRRKREIAVRRALGVSRSRLYEQLTVESVMLALLGGAAAVLFAIWAGIALRRLVLPQVHWATGAVDLRTIAFVGGISLVVGMLAGVAPAAQAMRPDLTESLKAGMREGAYRRSRVRSFLLVVQTALCIILLVGAGLFVRSLDNVKSIDIGYDPDNLMVARPTFLEPAAHALELVTAIPQIAERLGRLDGVEAVGFTSVLPVGGASFRRIFLPGRDSVPNVPGDAGPSVMTVSPDFFKAVGLRVRTGRPFAPSDVATAPGVVIVSETMARLYWPGEPALGKCIIFMKQTNPCSTVVGVVADAHRHDIIEHAVTQFYMPIAQTKETPRYLVVRTRDGRAGAAARATDQLLRQLVPGLDGTSIRQFADVLEPQLRPWRLGATLFTALGALAVVVAGIGVYSVVAYGVSQRTQEMGVRIALGARSAEILDLVLGEGLRVVVVGIAAGVAAAYALSRLVASFLFGVTPHDPAVFIGAAAVLCALGMLACLVPGWRAARVDPMTALRTE